MSATSGLALYSRGTDQHTENTASIVETPLLGLPHDRHPASSLARWLLPSNELQYSSTENTAPIVACWTVYRAVAWQRVDQICYNIVTCKGVCEHWGDFACADTLRCKGNTGLPRVWRVSSSKWQHSKFLGVSENRVSRYPGRFDGPL
jgi:hypothetical protein